MTLSEFEKKNQHFLDFLTTNGAILSNHFKIADYSTEFAGRGLKATKELPLDTQLFSIPYQLCLGPDTSRIHTWVYKEPELWNHEWAPSITAVLYELCFYETSFWKPYFDILPSTFDTPIFWSEKELSHLKGTETLANLGKEECESLFTNVILPILKKHFKKKEEIHLFTLEKFHYAGSLLMAYGFQWNSNASTHFQDKHQVKRNDEEESDNEENENGIPVLIPLADTLNAITPSSAHLVYLSNECIAMNTSCTIPPHHQIYNTYGERSASELLRRYGYIEWNSKPYDFVSIQLDLLVKVVTEHFHTQWNKKTTLSCPDIEKELNKRLRYLDKHNLLHESFDLTYSELIPIPLLVTLRILLIPFSEWNELKLKPKKLLRSCSSPSISSSSTSVESRLLENLAQLRLNHYPESSLFNTLKHHYHSVSNVMDYLRQAWTTTRIAMAYFVRIQEMGLLNAFLQKVAKKVKKMDKKIK